MRWEDERYVRIYTRDTVDWLGLSFLAQGLLCLILRKVDRAGLLKLGKPGKRGVAIVIGFAGEWARLEPALEELLADGCVQIRGEWLVAPNFIEAQEAPQSDAQRKRESRAKDRDRAAAASILGSGTNESQNVPEPDNSSENVTDGHDTGQKVTSGHTASQVVTPCLAVPCRTDPEEEDPPPRAHTREAGAADRDSILAGTQGLDDLPATLAVLRLLHAAGKLAAAPSPTPRVRRRDEELIAGVGANLAAQRVLAAWDPVHPTLGWYPEVIAAKPPRPNGARTTDPRAAAAPSPPEAFHVNDAAPWDSP